MLKQALVVCASAVTAIVLVSVFLTTSTEENTDDARSYENLVSITVSSSRPGCEKTDTCYVPPEVVIYQGDTVAWINDDSAFHTVTSGFYDEHDGLFDSGQLDPSQIFSFKFDEGGYFDYYCRLHPWMDGQVIVRWR
ncbi:MAG: plastocyanin/azurin family copper-binding protein [Candidatus Nitrosotenuis sp.]